MKKIIALLLSVLLCFSLCACGKGVSSKDRKEIIKIVSDTIDSNIEKRKSSGNFSKYINIDDVSYEITKVIKDDGEYVVTIIFKATTEKYLSDTQKSLACYSMEELFRPCYYNDKKIDIIGSDSRYGETYHHVSSWINGVEIHSMTKNSNSSSKTNTASSRTCKFCKKKFTDSSNTMSIAKTGMCSNCSGNYKSMSQFIGR